MKTRRIWRFGPCYLLFQPLFWVLAIGIEMEKSFGRSIGIGIGPFYFSIGKDEETRS